VDEWTDRGMENGHSLEGCVVDGIAMKKERKNEIKIIKTAGLDIKNGCNVRTKQNLPD
jgi:hypothetical protein